MNRDTTITEILENMNLTKRGMVAHMHRIIGTLPVSPSQLEMLYMIQQSQPISTKSLAHDRQLTPGAISQITDVLAQHGFIARANDAADRRTHFLSVTKTGEKLLQKVKKRRDELFRHVMHDFTDEELEVWLRIQQKIIQRLDTSTTAPNTTTTQTKGNT